MSESTKLFETYVPGILCVAIGSYALIARAWGAWLAKRWNYRIVRLNIDERHVEIGLLIGGIALVVIGMLTLSGIIRFAAPR